MNKIRMEIDRKEETKEVITKKIKKKKKKD